MLSRWKETFLERAPEVLDQGKAHYESEKRVSELERMVGRLTMELEIAKSLIAGDLSAGRKRELATMLAKGEDYPVKRVCEVLGLPRSTYCHEGPKRIDEQELREAIEAIVKEFPTYGTRPE